MERSYLSFLLSFPPSLPEGISTVTRKDLETNLLRENSRALPTPAGTNCRAENRILFRAGKHGEVSLRPTEQTAACNNINPNERLLVGIFLFLSSLPGIIYSAATNFHPLAGRGNDFSLYRFRFKVSIIDLPFFLFFFFLVSRRMKLPKIDSNLFPIYF